MRLKIDWEDVVELLCRHYHIIGPKLMKRQGYEPDGVIAELPDYIEGECTGGHFDFELDMARPVEKK